MTMRNSALSGNSIVVRNHTTIKPDKVVKLKKKLKRITRRNSPVNLAKVIKDINPVLRGFVKYFKIANCKDVLRSLMSWLRRRLRASR
ncbi:MAG: group II intron maturase-specific domain-containing protein [Candidatus Zixiibacteriota bacterium]